MTNKAQNHLSNYLEGWRQGDGAKSKASTASNFYYDDPNTGRIEREDFIQFVDDFKDAAAEISGGKPPQPFLQYTHQLVGDGIAWCWWCVNGTSFQGSALITFNDDGVTSEKIAYFTSLPDQAN